MSTRMLNDDELEENWIAEQVDTINDDDIISAGSEDEFEDDYDLEPITNKRTHNDMQLDTNDIDLDANNAQVESKTKKQKMTKSTKDFHKMTRTEIFQLVHDVYTKQHGGHLTSLELADGLKESHFEVPINLGKHTLENLPLYLRHYMPNWKKDFLGRGIKRDKSPNCIILCASALRAVEVLKHLTTFRCRIAKLFAKHMNINDQVKFLATKFHPMAVGTPGRVKKLLEMKALSLKRTTHILLDMGRDKKELHMLQLKDVASETVDLIEYHLLPVLNSPDSHLKLVLQ